MFRIYHMNLDIKTKRPDKKLDKMHHCELMLEVVDLKDFSEAAEDILLGIELKNDGSRL